MLLIEKETRRIYLGVVDGRGIVAIQSKPDSLRIYEGDAIYYTEGTPQKRSSRVYFYNASQGAVWTLTRAEGDKWEQKLNGCRPYYLCHKTRPTPAEWEKVISRAI